VDDPDRAKGCGKNGKNAPGLKVIGQDLPVGHRVKKDPLHWSNITFALACREDTGRHLLDSGGDNDRIYDRPPIPDDQPLVAEWRPGQSATISTAALLTSFYTLDRRLQKQWQDWHTRQTFNHNARSRSWLESGRRFVEFVLKKTMDVRRDDRGRKDYGYLGGDIMEMRDNIYNEENDLDQVFVYEIYNEEGERNPYYANEESVIVIYVHTGCDVRGGYGRPLFCRRPVGEFVLPVVRAEYRLTSLQDGTELDSYDSFLALDTDVETWHEDTRIRDSVETTMKSGGRCLATACVRED